MTTLRAIARVISTTLAWTLVLAPFALPDERQAPAPRLDIRWSLPISGDRTAAGDAASGLDIWDIDRLPDGRLVVIGHEGGAPAIAVVDETGLGPATRLKLKGFAYQILAIPDGSVWLGGRANQGAYVPGGDMSDAYVAHVSQDGRVLAEHTLGAGYFRARFRTVDALAVLPSAALMVAARDGRETWVAKIAPDGSVAWEQRFGLGKGAGIAALSGNRIAVTTFDVSRQADGTYSEGIITRLFNEAGARLTDVPVRQGLNTSSGADYGTLASVAADDAVYVLSGWSDPASAQPIEVAKVEAGGIVPWRRLLPDTIARRGTQGRPSWLTCTPSLTVLQDGDAMVACGLQDRIDLYVLNRANGDITRTSIPAPECHRGRPMRLFPFMKMDGSLWIFGTRPLANVGRSCSWFGRIDSGPPR